MKILCTGATGFIGTNLIPVLLKQNHNIAVLKRKKSDLKQLKKYKKELTVYNYSTYRDIHIALQKYKPETVIHLATLYINKHSENDIEDLCDSNILFGTQLLEAMKNSGTSRILNFGTRWQHINNKLYNPANLYAATKQAFADILCYYNVAGIRSKTIELCDTFGKNDTRKKIVSLLVNACKNKIPLDLSPGEQILDITYVENLTTYIADNIVKDCFFDNTTTQISGTKIKLKNLGTLIEEKYNVNGFLRWGTKNYRENEIMEPPLCKDIPVHCLQGNLGKELP